MRIRPIFAIAILASPAAAQNADYTFSYAYPAAARAIPALRRWFEADRATTRAAVARDAAAFRREAAAKGFPFRRYEDETGWKVVTQTPRFLSLSGTRYSYIGGAHGGTKSLSMIWDRAARRRLSPNDVFASPSAIRQAIGARFCKALDAERARRRGAPVTRGADPFTACPAIRETTLLLGSTNRRAIDRIGVIADQYVAGAYAEGAYEVTLPVDATTLAAVKPAYRNAFAIAR